MDSIFPLKKNLAAHGFSSEESYDHGVQCFLNSPTEHIRCLHIDGDSGRRRTAFAHALANVLKVPHVLYFEFGRDRPAPQVIRIQEGEEIIEEPPVEELDRVLTEACAQSEAEPTVLILDQLHKTRFLNHIRLYEFLQTGEWRYSDVQFQANPLNLKVFLISDEPLYHSLQRYSFRLWVADQAPQTEISAADLGLDKAAVSWLEPLQSLFRQMGISPTLEEYRHLAYDIEGQIHNLHQLEVSLFGWVEAVDRAQLETEAVRGCLNTLLEAILQSREVHEEIEISANLPE